MFTTVLNLLPDSVHHLVSDVHAITDLGSGNFRVEFYGMRSAQTIVNAFTATPPVELTAAGVSIRSLSAREEGAWSLSNSGKA